MGGLILSERVPFNLDEVSVEDEVGIRLCWDCNSGQHRSQMKCLAKLDNFIFAKMRFLENTKYEVRNLSMAYRRETQDAKHLCRLLRLHEPSARLLFSHRRNAARNYSKCVLSDVGGYRRFRNEQARSLQHTNEVRNNRITSNTHTLGKNPLSLYRTISNSAPFKY